MKNKVKQCENNEILLYIRIRTKKYKTEPVDVLDLKIEEDLLLLE